MHVWLDRMACITVSGTVPQRSAVLPARLRLGPSLHRRAPALHAMLTECGRIGMRRRTGGSACDGQRKRLVVITAWLAESIAPMAAALERMAATGFSLGELSLCFCALGDSGVELLAHALAHNRTLATVRPVGCSAAVAVTVAVVGAAPVADSIRFGGFVCRCPAAAARGERDRRDRRMRARSSAGRRW